MTECNNGDRGDGGEMLLIVHTGVALADRFDAIALPSTRVLHEANAK